MPATTPTRPLATARRNPAAKTILRSRGILALEELHRAASARLSELERRLAGVVADVGAHVLGEEIVNQDDIVVRDRSVQGGVPQARILYVEVRARVGQRLH